MYGLTPRFSESKCPECGGGTEQIERDILKKALGIYCYQELCISFVWKKIKTRQHD
jgi:hypothetical protein